MQHPKMLKGYEELRKKARKIDKKRFYYLEACYLFTDLPESDYLMLLNHIVGGN